MNETISLATLAKRVDTLESQARSLITNNNALLARQTASTALLQALLWGWGKSRKEVGDEILKSGAASLASVSSLPSEMQKEVVDVWNAGYAALMGPSHQAFQVGQKPGQDG